MPRREIVEPEDRAEDERFRRILALFGPVLGIIAIVIVISAVSVHSYHVTRERVIQLTQNLLHEQQKFLTREVSDYLGPAPQSATIAKDLLTEPLSDTPPRTFLDYSRSLLDHLPQIDSLFIADDSGMFWFVTRAPKEISDGVEWVHLSPGKDVFRHWYYDHSGKLINTLDKPGHGYDPRTRAWYQEAVHHPEVTWTDPYPSKPRKEIFSTASSVLALRNGHKAVFAVTLSLTRLSEFLKQMKIGRNGRAVIVDKNGGVVAGNNLLDIAERADWKFDRMVLDARQAPVFTRALSLFRIYGSGASVISEDDTSYVTIYSSLDRIRPGWLLILDTPESDYANIISFAGWQGFAFSLLIILLASGLAALLLRQKRRTLRARRELEHLREVQRASGQLIGRLVEDDTAFDTGQPAPILSETLAEVTGVPRIGLWRVFEADRRLICEDAFDAATGLHRAGMEISVEEAHPLIDYLGTEGVVTAASDVTGVLQPLWRADGGQIDASDAVYAVTRQNRVNGFMMLRGAKPQPSGVQFIPLISDIVALRFASIEEGERAHARCREDARVTEPQSATQFAPVIFSEASQDNMDEGRYPAVAVATIQFDHQDSPDTDATIALFRTLASQLEAVARRALLCTAQLAGNRVILVGQCTPDLNVESVRAVASALLDLREAAQKDLSAVNMVRNFSMGMDVGAVLSAHIGSDGAGRALWGEAFTQADHLAQSSPENGTIQVSNAVQSLLKDDFLFRPRGAFFVPGRGLGYTHILAARR